jgi:effector-binding domain-containing protein
MGMTDQRIERRVGLPYVAVPMTLPASLFARRIPEGYRELDLYLGERGLEERGPSIIRYRRGSETGPMDIEVGWVMDEVGPVPDPFIVDVLPAGVYLVGWHNGPYAGLVRTMREVFEWGQANGLMFDMEPDPGGNRWGCWYELYLAEPMSGPAGPSGSVEVCLLTRS